MKGQLAGNPSSRGITKRVVLSTRILQVSAIIAACLIAIATIFGIRDHESSTRFRIVKPETDGTTSFSLDSTNFIVAIPDDSQESASLGTLKIYPADSPDSFTVVERDGSFESLLIQDVNGDDREDAVIVVRCAGSGQFVTLYSVLSGPDRFTVSQVPEPPASMMSEYQGRDCITLSDGRLIRSFPTYANKPAIRIDHQWTLEQFVAGGRPPVRYDQDGMISPSGPTLTLMFSFTESRWRRL